MLTALSFVMVAGPALSVPIQVDGEGYLRLSKDMRVYYARQLVLCSVNGKLGCSQGAVVLPEVAIPASTTAMKISLDGTVTLVVGGQAKEVGKLILSVFPTGTAMTPQGGLYTTLGVGRLNYPGDGLAGVITTVNGSTGGGAVVPSGGTPVIPTTTPQVGTILPGSASMTLKTTVESDHEQVTLGEIAEISGDPALAARIAGLQIEFTPPVGVSRRIDLNRILARLRGAGIDPAKVTFGGASVVELRHVSQTVLMEDLVKTAVASLQPLVGTQATLNCTSTASPILVPVGAVQLVASTPSVTGVVAAINIDIFVAGAKVTTKRLTFSVAGSLPRLAVGSTVKVIAQVHGVRIETQGKVLSVGTNGTTVEVMTEDQTRVTGFVQPDGSVKVNL